MVQMQNVIKRHALRVKCTFPFLLYLHFDIGVRVAIGVHGRQMDTAHDAYNETVLLGTVHEVHQNPAALFYLCAIFPRLKQRGEGNSSVGFTIKNLHELVRESIMFRHAWK